MKTKKVFVLYDARARLLPTEEATVLEMCDTEKEALKSDISNYPDAIWYEYDDEEGVLTNEKSREDLSI